jgi:hypothetical protein
MPATKSGFEVRLHSGPAHFPAVCGKSALNRVLAAVQRAVRRPLREIGVH